jgi:hypothetical protein
LGSEGRKKKGKGEGRLTGGPQASVSRGKRKRRGGEVGRRGEARRAAGPSGLKRGADVVFFFFSFSNFIFKPFFISNSNQTFSNFFSRIL